MKSDEQDELESADLLTCLRSVLLGGRPVAGHMPLEHGTLVRIQASQPNSKVEIRNSKFEPQGLDDFRVSIFEFPDWW